MKYVSNIIYLKRSNKKSGNRLKIMNKIETQSRRVRGVGGGSGRNVRRRNKHRNAQKKDWKARTELMPSNDNSRYLICSKKNVWYLSNMKTNANQRLPSLPNLIKIICIQSQVSIRYQKKTYIQEKKLNDDLE